MSKPKFRSRFSLPSRAPKKIEGESMTQQHFEKESNINNMVKLHLKGGPLGNPNATRQPFFGDFSSLDYLHMRNTIADVDQNFMSLPSKIRKRFDNSAYQLIRFLDNPDNLAEARKLGLVEPEDDPFEKDGQLDLVKESEKAGRPVEETGSPGKADEEAQPPPPRQAPKKAH